MNIFPGTKGKENIIAEIVKMINELHLEDDDKIYFEIIKHSASEAIVEHSEKQFGLYCDDL